MMFHQNSLVRSILPLCFLLLLIGLSQAEQRIIPLYEGKPPGSESWTYQEQESKENVFQTRLIYNVTEPSLTVLSPSNPNGTSLIVCPGGGFHCLSIDSEGLEVAQWLVEKGVTCFVLKYRLVECKTNDPGLELLTKGEWPKEEVEAIVKLATADGLRAIEYVRSNAEELGVDPQRIGIIGFSAGGTLAVSAALTCTTKSRPNFIAPIYAKYDWALNQSQVPSDAPPIFLLAATDDQLGLAADSVQIYQDWLAAKKPAELHLYADGGHGFGMRRQNLPSDRWIELFAAWMKTRGLID